MKQLTELLTYRALHFKLNQRTGIGDSLLDNHLERLSKDQSDLPKDLKIKNICAKVSEGLSDDIDRICDLLGLSKRRFIESALISALAEADRIISELDIFEDFDGRNEVK